jgi:hydroxyacylglutathione hydrolase
MKLLPVPAFSDNYLWLWLSGTDAIVVDPGDAEPVLQALSQQEATLRAILVTHHHADHVGGVQALQAATGARVLAPAAEGLSFDHEPMRGGECVDLLGLRVQVMDVPGHTAGHIAYWIPASPLGPVLFCGDTLFSGGCGRIFEGTPAQMLQSLDTLAALPADTLVCCAHEYTLSNLAFAKAVEPANAALFPPCRPASGWNDWSTLFCARASPALSKRCSVMTQPRKARCRCLLPCAAGRTTSNDNQDLVGVPGAVAQRLRVPDPEHQRRAQRS